MKLESLTVQNFRSITKAYKLRLATSTVLIGPNNEGKSNVLRALVLATRLLIAQRGGLRSSGQIRMSYEGRFPRQTGYDWDRDFPLPLQDKQPDGESVFILEYALTDAEVDEFRTAIGSNLNGTLPLRIAVARSRPAKITVNKKGPGGAKLTAKTAAIADFVAKRIELEYIPAVRTAASAQRVVDEMVARELEGLEQNQDYIDAIQRISDIQAPILKELSQSINDTLVQFLPAVRSVDVRAPMERRLQALRRCEIHIDDGSMTELQYKGDGVQSLAALALMRHASAKSRLGKNVVVAIEEPESHLHPRAIHEVRAVVEQLADKHQVVLTTHCPLFVARGQVESNIIVNNNQAKPAKTIGEIREVLGVRAADNLLHAELVLVVEGEDDVVALRALLAHYSPLLADALKKDRLAIDHLAGASNLSYKLGLLRDALCASHVFLDDDAAGRLAYSKAHDSGLLLDSDVNMTVCQGLDEAEFEDILDDTFVASVLNTHYRIQSVVFPKHVKKKKWSLRMEWLLSAHGKPWSERVCSDLKLAVARQVQHDPANALSTYRRSVFDALRDALETRLNSIRSK